MPKVTVYSTLFCPYCFAARRLLKHKGIDFEEIRVDKNPEKRQEMIQRSGRFTVPQIFIGDHHIGGYDDMAELNRKGKLDVLFGGELANTETG
jgi:glutaredoxin 3